MRKIRAEYIWIDGQTPTAKMRSKTKIFSEKINKLSDIPEWGFDGSSTFQANTDSSDLGLKPVFYVYDPIRGEPNILVLCEVFLPNGNPHNSNTRAHLRYLEKKYRGHSALFGIEQEYTLYNATGSRPLLWPKDPAHYPKQQGPYYCGVGSDESYGRQLVEAHTEACLKAGIALFGTNAEVMPAQWEFQIGTLGALEIGDNLWLARWLLYRLGENFGISARLDPKPISGDWNGAGAHTNFSTAAMRKKDGLKIIEMACKKLGKFHDAHIAEHVYGENNHLRLTGKYETCDIKTFRHGIGDRGASIRIPRLVAKEGMGYLEDRRPAANMDPYRVCSALLETICGNGFNQAVFSYFKKDT